MLIRMDILPCVPFDSGTDLQFSPVLTDIWNRVVHLINSVVFSFFYGQGSLERKFHTAANETHTTVDVSGDAGYMLMLKYRLQVLENKEEEEEEEEDDDKDKAETGGAGGGGGCFISVKFSVRIQTLSNAGV
jgi:hypothetical protein